MKDIMAEDVPKKELKKEKQSDVKKELKETQQEVMIDLTLKTNEFLEKLKVKSSNR